MARAGRGHANNATFPVTRDPTELEELLINGCSQRSCQMVAPLCPVKTTPGEAPSNDTKSAYINLPPCEKLFSACREVVFALIPGNQQSIAFKGFGQTHRQFTSEVIVAGASITDCDIFFDRFALARARNYAERLYGMRDFRRRDAVIAMSAFPSDLYESAGKQLRQVHAG